MSFDLQLASTAIDIAHMLPNAM